MGPRVTAAAIVASCAVNLVVHSQWPSAASACATGLIITAFWIGSLGNVIYITEPGASPVIGVDACFSAENEDPMIKLAASTVSA